ncbi:MULTISPECIES: alpha-amylase family glycosyl hydrolase [Xanthocytophaga]|uniref:Alpha-amylase family glycosyl hydrolase n=2 Tax=Xanthocytophaga TaxID=3078918 RepID=A0AAE3QWY8_9BACT|nr:MULTISPECIES: alpha-amylase family glycosyl hydrolase [Xanthocytophaga]MDJ1484933.1 alpha-amylase family glycosyl hydrolase [Xanthocytophaga flavus]MDJ1504364.1 alpha-amylase family glycosyl hydrolase [Xanthocytophaga agilis]
MINYNKLKGLIWAFLLITVSGACKKDSPGPSFSYKQYGSPFQGVPERQNAAIYQVNLRAFSEAGTFKGVEARLDSVKALGINVLYLMPIYPVGVVNSAGGLGSPYSIKDYKAVNPEFGTLEDLRALVDAAHSKGMAVILDWVANHTSWDNEWITAHKDWYQQDNAGNVISPPGTGWLDVAQLNYTNTELRKAMIDAMAYWVYTANVDGFRCDAADYVPYSFWKEAIESLRTIQSHKLLILAEGGRNDHFKAGFDLLYGFNFFYTMSDKVFEEKGSVTLLQNVNTAEYAITPESTQRVVRYTTNHDVNLSDGTPLELFGGKQGSMSAFVVAAYMKGVPMIYNGQEIGQATRLQYFTRTPISWNTADYGMVAEYKKLLAFYNASNTVRMGELRSFSSDDVCVFTKHVEGETILVIANLRNKAVTYSVPGALVNTAWTDVFTNTSTAVSNQISLPAYSYKVLKINQ